MGGQFLYFVPNAGKQLLRPEDVKRADWGLERTLGEMSFTSVHCGRGPGGLDGVLCLPERPLDLAGVPIEPPKGPQQRPVYAPENQTWVDYGKYWVGLDPEWKPGPGDLMRGRDLPGYLVQMGDGNRWEVPIYRRCQGGSGFPAKVWRDKDGVLRRETCLAYREFEETGNRLFREWKWNHGWIEEGEREPEEWLTGEEQYCIALQALAMNYRVDDAEVNLLGLFTVGGGDAYNTVGLVLWALIDLQTVLAVNKELLLKKKNSGESTTTDSANGYCG